MTVQVRPTKKTKKRTRRARVLTQKGSRLVRQTYRARRVYSVAYDDRHFPGYKGTVLVSADDCGKALHIALRYLKRYWGQTFHGAEFPVILPGVHHSGWTSEVIACWSARLDKVFQVEEPVRRIRRFKTEAVEDVPAGG